jgi:hypothetical protein
MAEASQGDVVLTLAVGRGRRSRHTFDPTISILTISILIMQYTEGSLTDDPPPG